MLGSKRPTFKPTAYGYTRRKRRIPRWLVLMITGMVLGAGGLLFIQKSYGPPMLTVEQSQQLHDELNAAKAENQRLQSRINLAERERDTSLAQVSEATEKLTHHDAIVSALEKDLVLFADAMPADPRGTSPGIRAADFTNKDNELDYSILLMQDSDKADTTFKGTLSLNIQGRYPNGRTGYFDSEPVSVELGRYTHVQGAVELPSGMTARQVTIQVYPQDNTQRTAAMRIINVR
ncbi:DUF6776 family protein [Paenalcaligenes hominis]|uniref:DUF6776 family protein n=1 Tax=Paenalcaligenes hominis TaxID=643674 RepID=UPI0035253EF9